MPYFNEIEWQYCTNSTFNLRFRQFIFHVTPKCFLESGIFQMFSVSETRLCQCNPIFWINPVTKKDSFNHFVKQWHLNDFSHIDGKLKYVCGHFYYTLMSFSISVDCRGGVILALLDWPCKLHLLISGFHQTLDGIRIRHCL